MTKRLVLTVHETQDVVEYLPEGAGGQGLHLRFVEHESEAVGQTGCVRHDSVGSGAVASVSDEPD